MPLLILAGTIGVISPTGNEVGPFLAVEQAALSQTVPDDRRTATFAWYNLVGYVATASGALLAGLVSQAPAGSAARPTVDAYRADRHRLRASIGLLMAAGFRRLGAAHRGAAARSAAATASGDGSASAGRAGSSLRLSALFSLDAFAGGFIPQSLMAYWFHLRFGVEPARPRASIFFGANLLAAVSSLSAARIAARFGLINTMVFTHLPSNVLLHPRPADADPARWPSPSCCCASASARWTCRRASRT